MDCHGAARLAMTQHWPQSVTPTVIAPPAVIARNEAIHCGGRTKTWIATALRASQ
jgi:hypothetical protein